ncbi:MAG: ABC transporter ATP-binding protein [Lachnospiraceae bacterium]|nr:ABC transporter ATP-binding protein [Lachnospiraceae bacterium]
MTDTVSSAKGIELKNVSSGYGKKKILKDISLFIPHGEITAILGENGSGKTTLLRTVAGLIEYDGNIFVDGEEVKKMSHKQRAEKISLLSQMNSAYFSYSVYETVKMGRYRFQKGFFDSYKDEDIRFVEECMKRADILDIKDERIGELSGGQLQRVYLAQLFAQDSEYIFLDEPTNHLDLKYRVKLENELKESNTSTLVVYHDIRSALDMADNIILIKNGEIVKQGKTSDIRHDEALNIAFDMDVLEYLNKD